MALNDSDLSIAITGLTNTIERLEISAEQLGLQLVKAKQVRKNYLDNEVTRLLPSISKKTLQRLEIEIPQFVSFQIKTKFSENMPFLGIFKNNSYLNVLTLLQSKLAAYLERIVWSDLKDLDAYIESTDSKYQDISHRLSELSDTLSMLVKAKQKGIVFPNDVSSHIQNIVEKQVQTSSSNSQSNYNQSTNSDSNMDLWIYCATDMPTSFRTLMLSSLRSHKTDHVPQQRAIDTYVADPLEGSSTSLNLSTSNQGLNAAAMMMNTPNSDINDARDWNDSQQSNDAPIATDDSLGAFS